MIVSIEVEDESWSALAGLEDIAHQAIAAALAAAEKDAGDCEVALLFTDDASIADINGEWRGKTMPTNVLSFPAPDGMPVPEGEPRPLGDIALSFGVITREAAEQGKTLRDHTVHLIVHGTLHLIGYDHESDGEAEEMEQLETAILKGLGISNPYE